MEAPHLLVVDDDARIRSLLVRYLRGQGFLVTAARDAAQARRLLAGLAFDLLVLDVMMPGEDGVSLLAALRRRGDATPALLLTAKAETDDRIAGLEAGADDYLSKPFDPKELLLRLGAILRRAPPPRAAPATPQVLALGPHRYDVARGELLGGPRLTATESGLLKALAATAPEPVSRAALVEALRLPGADAPAERAVDVQVTRLRRKIEPDPREPRYLQTVRGAGYRLRPD